MVRIVTGRFPSVRTICQAVVRTPWTPSLQLRQVHAASYSLGATLASMASTRVSHSIGTSYSEKRIVGLHGSVLHEQGLLLWSICRHRLQLDRQDVGRDELHKLNLVRSVCCRRDLELWNLVTDLMLRGGGSGLHRRGGLHKLMVGWQLHDLELGCLLLVRCLDRNWSDNGHGCGRLCLANGYARGKSRVGVREQALRRIHCTRALFLVLKNLRRHCHLLLLRWKRDL